MKPLHLKSWWRGFMGPWECSIRTGSEKAMWWKLQLPYAQCFVRGTPTFIKIDLDDFFEIVDRVLT